MSLWSVVCDLYDAGWRSSDRLDLIEELDLTEKQADEYCELLDEFQREEEALSDSADD